MKLVKVLNKILKNGKPVLTAQQNEIIKKCGCPCHEQGVYISHFVPCCKYTDKKLK
ncbi:hypothetical protein HYQ22_gp203 [Acinetobacter phage vB_AbaM_Kimel]|uniref:Uncharacterized protein n=3 Tax=Lazarusvirus kimel TaxID=2843635 RepID=A0A6B9LQC8_9CAUD|nr:hypothetical protein HYQ22_gp203 [Acinetobacter phage vB_AbaM_Kimel]QHB48348.1 hypothetical protein Kimel_193 [Acinetobacter phage vB_AbaM_Kimel]QKE55891.1 hypothetical protein Octan_189 [Acinetobacter phage Octan]QNO11310.1 hypothetical protein Meroveus_189 [Acinetobacter phage Meroveus]